MTYVHWTPEEDKILARDLNKGVPNRFIAVKLGRCVQSVRKRIERMERLKNPMLTRVKPASNKFVPQLVKYIPDYQNERLIAVIPGKK